MLKFLERKLVYHPTPAGAEWLAPPNQGVRDVALRTADGTSIHAWWCPYEGATGSLLYCHGNAGNLSQRNDAIAGLQSRLKESVLIFDYPGFGKSAGQPGEEGCYAAADAAYDWLIQERHIPSRRILLFGGSLGGGVAVELASRRDHRALILINTFTSAPDVGQTMYPWLPVHWLMRNRFNNLDKIGRCRRPTFIAAGTADQTIPFTMSERLFAAANEPKFFHRIEGGGHDDPIPGEVFDALREFLESAEKT